jgi:hypothetical protein
MLQNKYHTPQRCLMDIYFTKVTKKSSMTKFHKPQIVSRQQYSKNQKTRRLDYLRFGLRFLRTDHPK